MNQAGVRPDLGIVDANGAQVLACQLPAGPAQPEPGHLTQSLLVP